MYHSESIVINTVPAMVFQYNTGTSEVPKALALRTRPNIELIIHILYFTYVKMNTLIQILVSSVKIALYEISYRKNFHMKFHKFLKNKNFYFPKIDFS